MVEKLRCAHTAFTLLKANQCISMVFHHFRKSDNFCDFLFCFPGWKSPIKLGSALKGNAPTGANSLRRNTKLKMSQFLPVKAYLSTLKVGSCTDDDNSVKMSISAFNLNNHFS